MDFYGRTELHKASEILDLEKIKSLLEDGANPNALDKYGVSPLFYVLSGKCENIPTKDMECSKKIEIMDLLRHHGADFCIKTYQGNNLMYQICINKVIDEDIFQYLIKMGVDLNNQNLKSFTTLHIVCAHHKLFQVVLFLLNNGANPNIKDIQGNFPINYLLSSRKEKYLETIEKYQNWVRRKSSMIFLANQGLLTTSVVDGFTVLREINSSNNPKLVGTVLSCLSQVGIHHNIISFI